MTVEKSTATIDAGVVTFSVRYVDQDGRRGAQTRQPEQGVSIQVLSDIDGTQAQLLRFDCLDRNPHYHYGPEKQNERVLLDATTAGNPVAWVVEQCRTRLPAMIQRAGYEDVAKKFGDDKKAAAVTAKLDEVALAARETALKWRRTVTHNGSAQLREIPDTEVIEAGNIRFGLEFRELPSINSRGMAIHVLSDVAGQEIELLAFDCFDNNPHYHYGPRNKDVRHYWDTTMVPDPLRWTLDRFKEGKLAKMIEWAGYPSIAAEVDTNLIARKLETEIEPRSLAIRAANIGTD
jgi:hypothetical protein